MSDDEKPAGRPARDTKFTLKITDSSDIIMMHNLIEGFESFDTEVTNSRGFAFDENVVRITPDRQTIIENFARDLARASGVTTPVPTEVAQQLANTIARTGTPEKALAKLKESPVLAWFATNGANIAKLGTALIKLLSDGRPG